MDSSKLELQEIYDAFQPRILRYLKRMVGANEAEDLTQEVFMKVGQALESFRGESKLSTWLYRIATNAALDRLRSPSFQRIAPMELTGDSTETGEAEIENRDFWTGEKTPSVEQQFVRKEMNECIRDFIEKLPENYRAVLVLSEMEGLRNDEIALILGVTLDTVKIRLHRARKKLKEELETHCDAYWLEDNEFVPNLKNAFDESRKTD
jgi:RNA polymerase sigma-70 factor (ECF subfamily)